MSPLRQSISSYTERWFIGGSSIKASINHCHPCRTEPTIPTLCQIVFDNSSDAQTVVIDAQWRRHQRFDVNEDIITAGLRNRKTITGALVPVRYSPTFASGGWCRDQWRNLRRFIR